MVFASTTATVMGCAESLRVTVKQAGMVETALHVRDRPWVGSICTFLRMLLPSSSCVIGSLSSLTTTDEALFPNNAIYNNLINL